MALRPILISGALLIIAILGIFKLYTLFHRPLDHHLNSDMQMIGIIDVDGAHDIDLHAILNGEKSVLIVDHGSLLYQEIVQKIPQAKYLTPEEIFNVNNLHLFDKDGSGMLTSQDPIFNHLFVIRFYDNGQQNDIKSLSAAEIKAISTHMTPTGDHEVTMADGTQRTLYSATKAEKAISSSNP